VPMTHSQEDIWMYFIFLFLNTTFHDLCLRLKAVHQTFNEIIIKGVHFVKVYRAIVKVFMTFYTYGKNNHVECNMFLFSLY
jgi:hypothetical protein